MKDSSNNEKVITKESSVTLTKPKFHRTMIQIEHNVK